MKALRLIPMIFAAALACVPAMAQVLPFATMEASESAREREEELYDDATDELDEQEWRDAASKFRRVADMRLGHADAALYWLAYSQNRMGQRSEALATIGELQKMYPKSRWSEDAKALEVEVRQSAGQRVSPDAVDDEELKLVAVNALMHTDPERAIPILEKILTSGTYSPKIKDRALFVLSQSSSPRAMEILGRIAKGGANPDLQNRALKYLGIMGGKRSADMLAEVYASSNDIKIKKTVLKSYMVSGNKERLLTLAKGETNSELRGDAISQLGVMGAKSELAELYGTEREVPLRKKIIQAMFIGGNSEKLAEIARTEKVQELRLAAIKNLGLLGGTRSGQLLLSLYETDPDPQVKKTVINALFVQGNAKTLVDLARKEKNPEMKKAIINKLSVMGSKEATDYLMEFLNE